jgi:hypothetical protein
MTAAVDTTRLVERLAAQMATGAVRHPVAAALAIACRGTASMDVADFATSVGLDVPTVAACEAGDVAFGDLPARLVADHDGLDLLALADLDAWYASRRSAQVM